MATGDPREDFDKRMRDMIARHLEDGIINPAKMPSPVTFDKKTRVNDTVAAAVNNLTGVSPFQHDTVGMAVAISPGTLTAGTNIQDEITRQMMAAQRAQLAAGITKHDKINTIRREMDDIYQRIDRSTGGAELRDLQSQAEAKRRELRDLLPPQDWTKRVDQTEQLAHHLNECVEKMRLLLSAKETNHSFSMIFDKNSVTSGLLKVEPIVSLPGVQDAMSSARDIIRGLSINMLMAVIEGCADGIDGHAIARVHVGVRAMIDKHKEGELTVDHIPPKPWVS